MEFDENNSLKFSNDCKDSDELPKIRREYDSKGYLIAEIRFESEQEILGSSIELDNKTDYPHYLIPQYRKQYNSDGSLTKCVFLNADSTIFDPSTPQNISSLANLIPLMDTALNINQIRIVAGLAGLLIVCRI